MYKELINPVTLIATLFIVGILLSGCSLLHAGAKTNESTKPDQAQVSPNPATDAVSQSKQVLWDFRSSQESETPKFSKAETGAVVKYLFGENASPDLEITSRVSGSFTKPNAKETLYFLSGCKDEDTGKFMTDCPHVSWNTAGWIAIYDGTTPVTKIEEALGGPIIKVTDVNGDGINEILSIGGYGGMGLDTGGVGLGQISGDKFQDIQGFNGYYSNCADTIAGKKETVASAIGYVPTTDGKMPTFTMEYFHSGCADKPVWKKITKKQFDAYFSEN